MPSSKARMQAKVFGAQMCLTPREALDGQLLFCPQMYERLEMGLLRDFLEGAAGR